MRIEFPHTAREDVSWDTPELTLGSAPDNAIVLGGHQAAAHHLRLVHDRRGCVMQVLPGASRVYVNARPVRERALLRAGDVLTVGDCRLLLKADASAPPGEPVQVPLRARCPVALRAVAGPLSGRVFPLRERLELGHAGGVPLDLPSGDRVVIALGWEGNALQLSVIDGAVPVRLNGIQATSVALRPGDQIGVATHRFVVDAPGLQPEPVAAPASSERPLPEQSAGPRGEVWWLIATAAVLALAIALVLFVKL